MTTILPPANQSVPDISVCIANFNGGELVLDCLASVYAQLGDFTREVLVHDDASTDASLELIRSQYPDAVVLPSTENCGYCVSNNRMVKASTGRFILLLNNDAVLRPESLQKLLRFALEGHADDVLGLPQHASADGSLIDRGYCTDFFLNPVPIIHTNTNEVAVATGACLWIPRQTWDAVGGFPPWFESVAEDIYFCTAARLLGFAVRVLDAPGFDHWVGKSLGGGRIVQGKMQTTTRRRTLSERNKIFGLLCCYPWPALLLAVPLLGFALAGEAAFLVLSGAGLSKVRKIYFGIPAAIWQHRNAIAAQRRSLMQKRKATLESFFKFTRWIPQKLIMLARHGRPVIR